MKKHPSIGLGIPEILLPKAGTDLSKWAVIACDQFTSDKGYWKKAAEVVGDAPSTLDIIYPEAFLTEAENEKEERIESIRRTMNRYLDEGLFEEKEGLIYLEREAGGAVRKGLMICIDLNAYNYEKGSTSLIRATEGTIVDRIPPRVKIRKGAPIESPHIMVLIDDPEDRVIGPLSKGTGNLVKVYDFDLMADSGHITGYRVQDPAIEKGVVEALEALADPTGFTSRYGLENDTPVLLFAMGDGNHSLATAKAIWETTKKEASNGADIMDSPLRHALVEMVNLHDESLVFEPIHRVVFELASGRDPVREMCEALGSSCTVSGTSGLDEMVSLVDSQGDGVQKIGVITSKGCSVMEVREPTHNLAVGTLQSFLDTFMKEGGAKELDYVHDTAPTADLGTKEGNVGFYLPAMKKTELFKSVILDGALPRKTFSMGEGKDKRFYLECRSLKG